MITKTAVTQTANNLVVTLEKAKAHLRVDGTAEDGLIADYLQAAQQHAENYIGRAIGQQSLVIEMTGFETVTVPESTDDTLTKVEYYALGGTVKTELHGTNCKFRKSNLNNYALEFVGELPDVADRDDAVIVTIGRGYAAAVCPSPIKSAILLMVGDLYEKREDMWGTSYTVLSIASQNLLRAYKSWR
jgi:uncharacterized phiE125 gp8 family phage protein